MVDLKRDFCAYLLVVCLATGSLVLADSVSEQGASGATPEAGAKIIISDEDQSSMNYIKNEISHNYQDFNNINEVHSFLDKVKLLVQKHPKNVAFAQGNVKELFKLLSSEEVTRLVRLDTDQFVMPLPEERVAVAQRAIEEDELTRKLFGRPLTSLIENRKQASARPDDQSHKPEGSFFSTMWCKISGSCNN